MRTPGVMETEVSGVPFEIAYTSTSTVLKGLAASGYSLLYIHENGGSRRDFGGDYAESMLPNRRFASFDLPGYGDSSYPMGLDINGLTTIARDVINVTNLDRLTEPSYVLIGHGLGALVALNYGWKYPEEIMGIVTVDGPFGSIAKRNRSSSKLPERVPKEVFRGYSRLSAGQDIKKLIFTRWRRSRLCMYGESQAEKINPDLLARLTIRGIMHSEIPAAGLNAPLENPTDFYKCLVEFLDQNRL